MDPKCLANIQSEPAPYNRPCSNEYCIKTSTARGVHCSSKHKPVDTPVSAWDESLPPIGGDDYSCWCCCSCYALNTPIEATEGEFILIQNINAGDSVLTTGLDLNWKSGIVQDRTGDINLSIVPGLYLLRYVMPGESAPRDILVTPDHLFLMQTTKTLKKVQHLIPGNKLMTAAGEAAAVMFVAHGEYETSVQSINMEGEFDGKDLTGHLLNANGIVSTDYAVQAHYETNNLDDKIRFKFSNEAEIFEVGTKEYTEKFQSRELDSFLSAPEEWPKGFFPKRKKLVNVPAGAKNFLTPEQSIEIYDKSKFNEYSNGVPKEAVNKLFRIFSTYNNGVNFILDWNDNTVNAHAWAQSNQNYVLLTGGLVRLKGLYFEAFSLIVSDMLTRLFKNNCVAEADYQCFDILREVFPDSLYVPLAPKGIRQVTEELFDKISPGQLEENGDGICDNPSVACRKEAFWSGISFFDMPKCAVPPAQYFYLKNAYASYDLKTVTVVFDKPVNVASAESLVNYSIEPGVQITAAKVNNTEPGTVVLTVDGLHPAGKYIFSVINVVSNDEQSLGEEAYRVLSIP